jgi:formylglycine-generating enzyme required for sulfatase activity
VTRVSEHDWLQVIAGEYEIGLRPDEARTFAEQVAKEAREAAAADPDQLHPEREAQRVAEMWGNADYLYRQLAHSMPAHRVTLPAYAIARSPVTFADYARFVTATGARAPAGNGAPDDPVTGIAWDEASAFAKWADAELPTEAMWEAALRAGRSPYGAVGHDVYEWCADKFAPYSGADPIAVGRITPPPGGWFGTRTRRGGAIPGFPTSVVTRRGADPTLRLRDTTFRLVRR